MGLPREEHNIYGDLPDWESTGLRYELHGGRILALAAPGSRHQSVSMALSYQLYAFLRGKSCKVFTAPFDVFLFAGEGEDLDSADTVVQPDITVVCQPEKIDRRGCRGAPTLVMEILSDSTKYNDRIEKFSLYQSAGVEEYWIVDPESRVAAVHRLTGGRYGSPEIFQGRDKIPVGVLEGCVIDLAEVFTN